MREETLPPLEAFVSWARRLPPQIWRTLRSKGEAGRHCVLARNVTAFKYYSTTIFKMAQFWKINLVAVRLYRIMHCWSIQSLLQLDGKYLSEWRELNSSSIVDLLILLKRQNKFYAIVVEVTGKGLFVASDSGFVTWYPVTAFRVNINVHVV